jgi:hypothetical protein
MCIQSEHYISNLFETNEHQIQRAKQTLEESISTVYCFNI